MDASFDLKSSMSPKIPKKLHQLNKKPPSKLALKKNLRKSTSLPIMKNSMKNESIITIESKSSETYSSTKSENSEESPIIISDSESSFDIKQSTFKTPEKSKNESKSENKFQNKKINNTPQLSEEKYASIKQWLNKINNTEQNLSGFSVASTIQSDENRYKKYESKVAVSSTFMEPSSKRFDEFFKNKGSNKSIEIEDSLITEDNSEENKLNNLENSFSRLNLQHSLHKKQTEEVNSPENYTDYENVLDSVYGDSWRKNKEEILPSSEPQCKTTKKKVIKQIPKTERLVKNPYIGDNCSNNLLQTLQKARFKKALESPWVRSLKNICDSDTDSGDDGLNNLLSPIKLDFNDYENCNNKITSSSDNSAKVQTKTKRKNKNTARKPKTSSQDKEISETGCCSFLASLSSTVPMSRCHMSAWIYRNNFKENREQLTAKLFKLYNEEIFDNAIPANTLLEWNDRMRGTAGYCYCKKITHKNGTVDRAVRIVLSSKVLDSADRLRDTLVHEMCHAATWIVNQVADGHGSFWKSWADRAMKVFPELPPIKRCHQYVINTKYTYKCTNCGYSIGRHSKSLDIERKRCGYCLGKFEVFINKTSKNGETRSVPATPKKALNGFAKFVKENYAYHKTPDLKHADVMKILGQKFSEMKVDKF